MSRQASTISHVRQSSPEYITRMRNALERVEGTCYSIDGEWYSPVLFNMTDSTNFFATGRAAWCLQNFTQRIYATEVLEQSSFHVADVLHLWNDSQLRIGRDAEESEETLPYQETWDVKVGVREKYSFLAVNFSINGLVEGSIRSLTGNSTHESPRVLVTANYTTESGETFECLAHSKYIQDEETGTWKRTNPFIEVCLIPISNERMVLGLFDDYDGADDVFQLVMTVALKEVQSFHDLNSLRAVPWMVGSNRGFHTYRELGTLAILCNRMITQICTAGFGDVSLEFGDRLATVPTWSNWGMLLLGISMLVIVSLNLVMSRLQRSLKLRGNLATANGVAEHWIRQERDFEEFNSRQRVCLVADNRHSVRDWVRIGVRREEGFGKETSLDSSSS
ncbi:hypothetical protein FGB62_292g05 [Gracilaria domingensis]|nr:hypothetical protein FGB62_292g05 [Gracilaria domingensis]